MATNEINNDLEKYERMRAEIEVEDVQDLTQLCHAGLISAKEVREVLGFKGSKPKSLVETLMETEAE